MCPRGKGTTCNHHELLFANECREHLNDQLDLSPEERKIEFISQARVFFGPGFRASVFTPKKLQEWFRNKRIKKNKIFPAPKRKERKAEKKSSCPGNTKTRLDLEFAAMKDGLNALSFEMICIAEEASTAYLASESSIKSRFLDDVHTKFETLQDGMAQLHMHCSRSSEYATAVDIAFQVSEKLAYKCIDQPWGQAYVQSRTSASPMETAAASAPPSAALLGQHGRRGAKPGASRPGKVSATALSGGLRGARQCIRDRTKALLTWGKKTMAAVAETSARKNAVERAADAIRSKGGKTKKTGAAAEPSSEQVQAIDDELTIVIKSMADLLRQKAMLVGVPSAGAVITVIAEPRRLSVQGLGLVDDRLLSVIRAFYQPVGLQKKIEKSGYAVFRPFSAAKIAP